MVVHKNEANAHLMYKDNGNSQMHQLTQSLMGINIKLEDRDLWMRFFGKTNEMIVTRSGRYYNHLLIYLFGSILWYIVYFE